MKILVIKNWLEVLYFSYHMDSFLLKIIILLNSVIFDNYSKSF